MPGYEPYIQLVVHFSCVMAASGRLQNTDIN